MSSSSSAATGSDSRSSSPHTPEPSDPLDSVAIHSDFDVGPWYRSSGELLTPEPSWQLDHTLQMNPQKYEEVDQILHLDDLIQQHAYDECAVLCPMCTSLICVLSSPSSLYNSPEPVNMADISATSPTFLSRNTSTFHPSSHFAPDRIPTTKPVPPPASHPLKQNPSLKLRVVHPPKESCYNLAIMFPSLPEAGAKSRVETQIRVTVDLADSSSSSDPAIYDRVGSWKWLQLPRGTATKRRTRKQGKIDPDPQDILHLTATVTCASPPHNRVYSCTSCQTREGKRVAKKLAARVRPARSDSDSGDDAARGSKGKQHEDTTSIIQFNCAEVQDFASGSVVLPLRITCYCRHHREKLGFQVHFVMMDHTGRIVGTGTSKPIMITDDHKTPAAKHADTASGVSGMDFEWSREGTTPVESAPDARAPSKRKKDASAAGGKKRAKPYDSSSRKSRETSVVSLPSPATSHTRPPTPSSLLTHAPPLVSSLESDSSADVPATPPPPDYNPDVSMLAPEILPSPTARAPTIMQHALPFLFLDPTQPSQALPLPLPMIHRLIPNSGPTHGGTEVTILGSNFHPSLQLDCVFGDVLAGSTQRWSDNTLVCILPPRATPGVVAVWFNNFPKVDDSNNSPPSLFTYSDESDRALMELALQVVGLKMTGKIEDAKNVAMRIVGNVSEGSDMQNNTSNTTNMMEVTSAARSIRPLLLGQAGESEDYETRIIKFLSILEAPLDLPNSNSIPLSDALSHPSPTGQTLLHLASFLGFDALVRFLVTRGADLDARDRNGFTALHFAAIRGSKACATALLDAGADLEIVNAVGKTPQEVAVRQGLFDAELDPSSQDLPPDEDEEAEWGDAEEESDDSLHRTAPRRVINRRISRRPGSSGKRTPRRVDTPRSSTPSPLGPHIIPREEVPAQAIEDKQAASFIEMIQRTLAQFPGPPQLRKPYLPQLPQLPEMPAVPWGALPQLPMVFPVFVPWPAFLGGDAPGGEPRDGNDANKGIGAVSIRAAQELRGTWEAWEKWIALATGTARQVEETPPPMYTPRETEAAGPSEQEVPAASETVEDPIPVSAEATPEAAPVGRRLNYDAPIPVTEQEVNAYGYLPAEAPKKHDRMLLFFWLPILLIALMWATHNGVRMVFQTLRSAIPLRTGLRN
ncbi:hypothetical protein C8J57DRAFT_1173036 [Mycena rebaudengoi]|nr:hypothetical protein C8J57DRAFT_1173036 [Mycena rebaudengoi]